MTDIWSVLPKLPLDRMIHPDDQLIHLDWEMTDSVLRIRRLVPEAAAIPDATLILLWDDFSTYWVGVGFHNERWSAFVTYVVAVLVHGFRNIGGGSSEARLADAVIKSMTAGRSFDKSVMSLGRA
jgi:hypothetical protein